MPLTLHLDEVVREVLSELLAGAMSMPEGANMDDHFAPTLWGDLARFRRQVYEPLQGSRRPSLAGTSTSTLDLDSDEAAVLRDVLVGLAESWSGGVPWAALSPHERSIAAGIAARLSK